jgi:hypothetical protein
VPEWCIDELTTYTTSEQLLVLAWIETFENEPSAGAVKLKAYEEGKVA